jgi:hypothetical protein
MHSYLSFWPGYHPIQDSKLQDQDANICMHSVFIEDAFYQSTESLGNKSENQKNVAIACLLGRVAANAS